MRNHPADPKGREEEEVVVAWGLKQQFSCRPVGKQGFHCSHAEDCAGADTTLHPHFADLQAAMGRRKLEPVQRPEGSCPALEKIPGRAVALGEQPVQELSVKDSSQGEGHTLEQEKSVRGKGAPQLHLGPQLEGRKARGRWEPFLVFGQTRGPAHSWPGARPTTQTLWHGAVPSLLQETLRKLQSIFVG